MRERTSTFIRSVTIKLKAMSFLSIDFDDDGISDAELLQHVLNAEGNICENAFDPQQNISDRELMECVQSMEEGTNSYFVKLSK